MKKAAAIIAIICFSLILCSCQDLLNTVNDNVNKDQNTTNTPVLTLESENNINNKNEQDEKKNEKIKFDSIIAGDTITFGSYEQDNDVVFGKEPIEWIVLSVENDTALLLSKYAIDCVKYNKVGHNGPDWDNSYLRFWLNEEFLNDAFNKAEQEAIIESNLVTEGHPDDIETTDKIFVLSKSDLCNPEYGFPEDENAYSDLRTANITDYAYYRIKTDDTVADVYKGLYISEIKEDPEDRPCYYWVRETGKRNKKGRTAKVLSIDNVAVNYFGWITSSKTYDECICVRPAMWINTGD